MKTMIKTTALLGSTLLLAAGCDPNAARTGSTNPKPNLTSHGLDLNLSLVANQGFLDYGGEVPTDSPAAFLQQPDFGAHGYQFFGQQGAVITLETGSHNCLLDTVVTLFGPPDDSGARAELAEDHGSLTGTQPLPNATADYSCPTISRIDAFTLPATGKYLAVVTASNDGPGQTYGIRLTCNSPSCAPQGQLDFSGTRGAISLGTPTLTPSFGTNGVIDGRSIFAVGGFLFEHNYAVSEGLGNALVGLPAGNDARPNMRKVHYNAFGGPEATSCVSCHNRSGDSGAGSKLSDIFQLGDGSDPSTGLERNPPHLLGMGYRAKIAAEMTADLKAQLAQAHASAQVSQSQVVVTLTSKGVQFGTATVNPDGTQDLSHVEGVDPDLVVRPFGWKGREATLRRFIEGGFRVHFGMQTTNSVNGHCAHPNTDTFGTGSDCHDPDGDGVFNEINDAQLTSVAVWAALLPIPVEVSPADPTAQQRAQQGEDLFNQIGCATCHVGTITMNSSTFSEPSDTGENPMVSIDLTQGVGARATVASDGTTAVKVYSDFKRHDMGASLADSKPFKQIGANFFITTPLWGVADTAPYLHDGRAATLSDAILQHDGEGAASATAFTALNPDDQSKVIAFLETLTHAH